MFSSGLSLSIAQPRYGSSSPPGPVYDPDAQALFNRMTVQPSSGRKSLIEERIIVAKASTWWGKVDILGICASHHEQAGRVNWKTNRWGEITPVNNPNFEIDRGFTGDGVTSYLDTNYFATDVDAQMKLETSTFAVRVNTVGSPTRFVMGAWDSPSVRSLVIPYRSGDLRPLFSLNQSSTVVGNTVRQPPQMYHVTRTATGVGLWTNGSQVVFNTSGVTSQPTSSYRICGYNATDLSDAQVSMYFLGGQLTGAEMADMHSWFEVYRQAVGLT